MHRMLLKCIKTFANYFLLRLTMKEAVSLSLWLDATLPDIDARINTKCAVHLIEISLGYRQIRLTMKEAVSLSLWLDATLPDIDARINTKCAVHLIEIFLGYRQIVFTVCNIINSAFSASS